VACGCGRRRRNQPGRQRIRRKPPSAKQEHPIDLSLSQKGKKTKASYQIEKCALPPMRRKRRPFFYSIIIHFLCHCEMAPVQVQSCGFHFIISTKNKQKYPVNESNVHKTTTPQAPQKRRTPTTERRPRTLASGACVRLRLPTDHVVRAVRAFAAGASSRRVDGEVCRHVDFYRDLSVGFGVLAP
jgi:hypothetical protein